MSYLFSAALVAEYSPDRCSDGEPSAPSKSTPTPPAYWWPDRTTAACPRSPFGTTYARLTADHGEALLTWYRAGFRARTSASPGAEQASRANAPASGQNTRGSFARFDPDSRLWRTPQLSLLGGLESFSETWPRSGTMRNGACWERPMLVPLTSANASGSSHGMLPTPTATNAKQGLNSTAGGSSAGRPLLPMAAVMWPTPRACDGAKNARTLDGARREAERKGGPQDLGTAVKLWPTPTANDAKNSTLPPSQITRDGIPGELLRSGTPPGGQLNPEWVEWLMGWPIDWTALEASATDKSRSAPPKPGDSSTGG